MDLLYSAFWSLAVMDCSSQRSCYHYIQRRFQQDNPRWNLVIFYECGCCLNLHRLFLNQKMQAQQDSIFNNILHISDSCFAMLHLAVFTKLL